MDIVIACRNEDGEIRYFDLFKSKKYYNFQILESHFYLSKDVIVQDALKYIHNRTKEIDIDLMEKDLSITFSSNPKFDGSKRDMANLTFNGIHYQLIRFGITEFEMPDQTKSMFGKSKVKVSIMDLDNDLFCGEIYKSYKNIIYSNRRDKKILSLLK